jgi:hypothetical protein
MNSNLAFVELSELPYARSFMLELLERCQCRIFTSVHIRQDMCADCPVHDIAIEQFEQLESQLPEGSDTVSWGHRTQSDPEAKYRDCM